MEGRFFDLASAYFEMEGPQVMLQGPESRTTGSGLMFDVEGEGELVTESQLWMQVMRPC